MTNKKFLIVVAHPDDEVLGMGGTIFKHVNNGEEVNSLILGEGETSRKEKGNVEKRKEQAKKAAKVLGIKNVFFEDLPDNKFDSVPLLEITQKIEAIINKVRPNIVYTHHAYDLNIDHRLTFKAVLTACRPQPNFYVKKISSFEVLSSTEWQLKNSNNLFCPNEYVNITESIDKKLEALKCYKDEIRELPHPRSLEGVKILSQYRGIEVGCPHAEAFKIIRSLDD